MSLLPSFSSAGTLDKPWDGYTALVAVAPGNAPLKAVMPSTLGKTAQEIQLNLCVFIAEGADEAIAAMENLRALASTDPADGADMDRVQRTLDLLVVQLQWTPGDGREEMAARTIARARELFPEAAIVGADSQPTVSAELTLLGALARRNECMDPGPDADALRDRVHDAGWTPAALAKSGLPEDLQVLRFPGTSYFSKEAVALMMDKLCGIGAGRAD